MKRKTQRELDYWADYIRMLADRMGLAHWSFVVAFDKSLDRQDPPVAACNRMAEEGHSSIIRLSKHFRRDADPETQRDIVCHELVHCHLRSITKPIATFLESQTYNQVYQLMAASHHAGMEDACDDIAVNRAKALPLPTKNEYFSVKTPAYNYNGYITPLSTEVTVTGGNPVISSDGSSGQNGRG